jgi:NADPH-dependent ferric siderophore reductase
MPDARDRQSLTSAAHVNLSWIEREGDAPGEGERLERALRELPATTGDTFYWIATESRRARAMRLFLANERGIPNEWIRATGYWQLDPDDDE